MQIELEAPTIGEGEAPVSKELRGAAKANLATIQKMIEDGQKDGSLSDADMRVLAEWMAGDVKKPLDEANQADREREAIIASGITEKALGVTDLSNVVMGPGEVKAVQSGADSGDVPVGGRAAG